MNPYSLLEEAYASTLKPSEARDNNLAPQREENSTSLASVCISKVLLVEDRHIPSKFLFLYSECLKRKQENSDDVRNNQVINLLELIFHNWHTERTRLNYMRDCGRVIAAVGRNWIGGGLAAALNTAPVQQQHVFKAVVRKLRSTGIDLNSRYGTKEYNLFSEADVNSYDNPSFFDSAATDYLRSLFTEMLRTYCKHKLHMGTSVSDALFRESVPSWMEEDTEQGIIRTNDEHEKRVTQARDDIQRLLFSTDEKNNGIVTLNAAPLTESDVHSIDTEAFVQIQPPSANTEVHTFTHMDTVFEDNLSNEQLQQELERLSTSDEHAYNANDYNLLSPLDINTIEDIVANDPEVMDISRKLNESILTSTNDYEDDEMNFETDL